MLTDGQGGTCRNKEPSSDKGFFGLIFAMLVIPAIVILGIAFTSGYMVLSSLHQCCLSAAMLQSFVGIPL